MNIRTREQATKNDAPVPAATLSAPAPVSAVLRLQQTVGNQAVMRMLDSSAPLAVNDPGDRFEREADHVAEQVMSSAVAPRMAHSSANGLQRKCAHCEEEEEKQKKLQRKCAQCEAESHVDLERGAAGSSTPSAQGARELGLRNDSGRGSGGVLVQRKCSQCEEEEEARKLHRSEAGSDSAGPVAAGGGMAPPVVHDVLNAPGRPLDSGVRRFMEPRFGRDFGGVRVHTDSRAADSARSVNALAYTVGNNIVFGPGQYTPQHPAGQKLIAHELAHVVQQSSGGGASLQSKLAVGSTGDPAEREADAAAGAVMEGAGSSALSLTSGGPVVRRVYTTPQGIREARPETETLPDGGTRTITRRIAICPCRRIDETRGAAFYNPDIDELALAYRQCTGSRTWTIFGRYDSNASTSLQTFTLPSGTFSAGGSLSMRGDRTSGRVDVSGLGANEQPGGSVGGRATITIESRGYTFTASGEYQRLLSPSPGTARDQGQMSARICPPGWPFCVGAQGTVGDPTLGNSIQGTISSRDDVPAIHPTCSQCVCPRRLTYECHEEHPHMDPVTREFRYYFALDRSDRPTEEGYLQTANTQNFEEIARLLRTGRYHITRIGGFASPEYTISHNQTLSDDRATATAQLLRTYLDSQGLQSAVIPPQPTTAGRAGGGGGGELMGRRPAPTPSSQLNEIVIAHGMVSAEAVTQQLQGTEILNRSLESQFRGLFSDPRMTPDLRMELFGLDPNDPARPEVQAAVDAFLASRPGRTARPWERVFLLFRYGAIYMEGTEQHGTDPSTPTQEDCNRYARAAERRNDFGTVDHRAIESDTRSMDDTSTCDAGSGTASGDCRYVAAPSTMVPDAPEGIPRRIP